MLETIDQWIKAIAGWLDIIPVQGWAILAGIFIGSMVTQWVKRNFPIKVLFPKCSVVWQKFSIRLLALVCSFAPTYFIWPDDKFRVWAAIAVGFGTPTVYRAFSFFLYRRWPDLRDRLSGTGTG